MMKSEMQRLIELEGAFNVRDLGGYRRADGSSTAWRALLRADGLHRLSARAVQTLCDEGVCLVIDLRSPEELRAEPNPFANHPIVRYENVPLFAGLSPIAAMAAANGGVFDMKARYCQALDSCGEPIARVLSLIAEAPDGAVLFHCTAGKDRTGVIAALILLVAGVERDTVVDDYALTATIAPGLIEHLRNRSLARGIEAALIDQFLASHPETMHGLLDHLETRHGTVEAYLRSIGLGETHVERLRHRLAA